MRDRFPPGVAAKLKYYVYRLIDPRNGETFYVGKGKEDRVFTMSPTNPDHDGIPAEIDFAGGVRGKFYQSNTQLNLPIYLEADVQEYLAALAARKGVPLSELANDLLKKNIAILEAGK
jgi:hypothetical protein